MQLATIQPNAAKIGTCPHGLPLGACPICNGMGGGGGAKKADFSAKSGEMSWNECAAIGAFLKAQQNAKLAKEQDSQSLAQRAIAFQNAMNNASQKLTSISQFFTANTPAIIAKPINFILNTLIGGTINAIKNLPAAISNAIQTLGQKLADISDKLTAMMGEMKAAIEKKISETFSEFKKKIKSLFGIFNPQDIDDDDKQIEETKKAFQLKTFIHDLYNKFTNENKKDIEDER